ncbi:hypothetical protein TNCV_3028871 [Trichonephila clavipes]|nr:hypothetical protein TNCV_3028871 [Trichonephila clavipes]
MGFLYHCGIKARVDGMTIHILSRQGHSQTYAVNAQDYGNSVLEPEQCFAAGLYDTRNNDQLKCLPRSSTEASQSIAKQTAWHDVKSNNVLHDNARPHTS